MKSVIKNVSVNSKVDGDRGDWILVLVHYPRGNNFSKHDRRPTSENEVNDREERGHQYRGSAAEPSMGWKRSSVYSRCLRLEKGTIDRILARTTSEPSRGSIKRFRGREEGKGSEKLKEYSNATGKRVDDMSGKRQLASL